MNCIIPFNIPPYTGNEDKYVLQAMKSHKISGDGEFGRKCERWFEDKLKCKRALLTPSCTHALEMSAILIDIKSGDEVITTSYTFVSTANAFALRGAKIVFVDIRPDTMNIDETKIEQAITEKTKAIVVVHYAGVSCEMDIILDIAKRYDLYVIEDAAQGMMSTYKGRPLGTIGCMGVYSFHETKIYTSGGEGGILIINDERFVDRAEIIREKGTNRNKFFRGMVDKYTWVDIGSSYLMNEISAAYLWGNLEMEQEILHNRLTTWQIYYDELKELKAKGYIELPEIPEGCKHNAHMFYIKVKDLKERKALIDHFKKHGVCAVFHYVPLHTSSAGRIYGKFIGEDRYTTKESERLIRLPLYYGMSEKDIHYTIKILKEFYANVEL